MNATRHQATSRISAAMGRRRLAVHAAMLASLAMAITVAATPLVDARQLGLDADELTVTQPLGLEPGDADSIAPIVPSLAPIAEARPVDELVAAVGSQRADERVQDVWAPRSIQEAPLGEALEIDATYDVAEAPVIVGAEPMADPNEPLAGGPGAVVDPSLRLWSGTIQADGANLRESPAQNAPLLAELPGGTAVRVLRWVQGEELITENPVWAELESGGYVYSTTLRHGPLAEPMVSDAPLSDGRWIDIDLVSQTLVAYEGATPVRAMLISSGRPGWDTPLGEFVIGRRVEKETMDAATLVGAVPDGQATPKYKIEDVRHTQYFTADGAALHENTWRQADLFGLPGSHGCVSMNPEDAAWMWDWASTGTPIRVHE